MLKKILCLMVLIQCIVSCVPRNKEYKEYKRMHYYRIDFFDKNNKVLRKYDIRGRAKFNTQTRKYHFQTIEGAKLTDISYRMHETYQCCVSIFYNDTKESIWVLKNDSP